MLARSPMERRFIGAYLLFLLAAAIYAMVFHVGVVRAQTGDRSKAKTPTQTPAQNPENQSEQPALRRPGKPARVEVDVSKLAEKSSADAYAVCRLTPPAQSAAFPWDKWTSLGGPRVAASCDREALPVYAARLPEGIAVLVVNQGEWIEPYHLGIHLTRGAYTVERFIFEPSKPETSPRLERLESVILGGKGVLAKPGLLKPGTAAIYRCTNRTAQVMSAFKAVKSHVQPYHSSRPVEYARLMTPLREAEGHIADLSDGVQPDDRYASLKHVHRALLTVAHAQALCRNFRDEGRLKTNVESLEEALDGLEESLTELSAACLNLVPAIEMSTPDPSRPNIRAVTISLTNAGEEELTSVRIGASAPDGAAVQPAELAMFRSVRPGETIHATFTVRLADDSDPSDITADVSYFAAKVPAHLRLKAI